MQRAVPAGGHPGFWTLSGFPPCATLGTGPAFAGMTNPLPANTYATFWLTLGLIHIIDLIVLGKRLGDFVGEGIGVLFSGHDLFDHFVKR